MSKAQFPLKHFSDNLIFNTRGEVWAVYELKGFTYDYKGGDAKVFGFIMGQCTKALKGVCTPKVIKEELEKKLKS